MFIHECPKRLTKTYLGIKSRNIQSFVAWLPIFSCSVLSLILFREFLDVIRKAHAGELDQESGLGKLASLSEVNVDEIGVGGAKNFFEAKVCK